MASFRIVRPDPPPDAPLKHVIAEYKHKAQTVTCVCGWHGSTAAPAGQPSAWNAHVAEHRPKTTRRR